MKKWREVLVDSGATLQQAIDIMDKAAQRVVLVVGKDQKLHGVLTDGDVRRALLKQFALEVPVVEVMNARPHTASPSWSDSRLLATLKQHDLLQLPIVDAEDRVVGLVSLHDLLHKPYLANPVFIMAGGFGKRLRPLTDNCPKPMLKVGSKPILEQILLSFVEAGFGRFYISTHYMPEVIRQHFGDGDRWGVSIKYIHEEEPLGTGGALGLLPHKEIDQSIFMVNGDLLTSLNPQRFLEYHESTNGIATMCVREFEYQIPYGVVTCQGSYIKSMEEKPVRRDFINAGIYLLKPDLVRKVCPGTRIDMPELIEREIQAGGIVNVFPIYERWLDIGRMEDFTKACIQTELREDG